MQKDASQIDTNKYSVVKSLIFPLWNVSDNLERFLLSGSLFALILTLLSYLFDQTYLCVFNEEMARQLPCNHHNLYAFYFFVKLVIFSCFITVWYHLATNKTLGEDVYGYFLTHWRSFFKDFGFLFIFIFINLLPVVSGLLLLFRVPNPVWQIELVYFTFVSIGFIIPFVLIRFYALFAASLSAGGFRDSWQVWRQNFRFVWNNTSGKGFRIIVSASLLFMIVLFLLVSVHAVLYKSETETPQLYNFIAEFIFNLMTLLIIALIVNFIEVQKLQILEKSEK